MKVKVIKSCVVNGKSAKAGSMVEVSESEARLLKGLGRVEISEKKKAAE